MEYLARIRWGLILFAGWAVIACSQEQTGPVEVGTTQVELRSDLTLPDDLKAQSTATGAREREYSGPSPNSIQPTRRIPISAIRPDPEYPTVRRYEFLPALLDSRKKTPAAKKEYTGSWTMTDKPDVRAGRGFGVAAAEWTSPGKVHLDDAQYYNPTVDHNPYSEPMEHLQPMAGHFKSRKSAIFHSGGTGLTYLQKDEAPESFPQATQPPLSPIAETQVYFSNEPKTRVTLTPATHRLDMINGNENLNRYRFNQLP